MRTISITGTSLGRRLSTVVAAATAAMCVVVLGPATTAHAIEPDLTCQQTFTYRFNQPLTTGGQPFTATVTSQLLNCISPNGQHTDLQSATFLGTAGGTTTACLVNLPLFDSEGQGVFTFNTGQTGDLQFSVSFTDPGDLGAAGHFLNGPLANDIGIAAPFVPTPIGLCNFGGVTEFTALGQITFIHS